MEDERATPIYMLPGQQQLTQTSQMQNATQDTPQDTPQNQTQMIKMEIKKKQQSLDTASKGSFDITVDLTSILLICALFLASFLNVNHLSFFPESLKSSSFAFSVAKTVFLFVAFIFLKNYLFVFE